MKREGRQHGMVKTYPIISAPWGPRGPKPIRSPSPVPAAGPFAKVPTKPTAHSKFTAKCGRPMCRECHLGPPTKSRDKVKGAHGLRGSSSDVVSDYRLPTRRVVDAKFSGFSASTVLDYLDAHAYDDDCIHG